MDVRLRNKLSRKDFFFHPNACRRPPIFAQLWHGRNGNALSGLGCPEGLPRPARWLEGLVALPVVVAAPLLRAAPATTAELWRACDGHCRAQRPSLGTVGKRSQSSCALPSRPVPKYCSRGAATQSKCPAWRCPSSPPVTPQRVPGGSGQLGTPRVRPSHWAPRHRLGWPR